MHGPSRFLPVLTLVTLLATFLVACPPATEETPEAAAEAGAEAGTDGLDSEDARTLYAMGTMLARSLATLDLSPEELANVTAGMEDTVMGAEPKVEVTEYRSKIQAFSAARRAAASERETAAGLAFAEEQAAVAGAETLDSGLIFIEETAGTGDSPAATDQVSVHYHGTLRDGTVFDSSVDRGEPATFPLNRVIPCWTEAVQKMKPGGKARIICPADIAYGDRGSPPRIPPGATLAFDVELIEIVTPAPAAAPTPAAPKPDAG
ncbi:MAG: FKBP-type peptidyl-prolyl cis-trans isomerase [Myxococcales bacterium]|nr:FKBP-type peptidyl-prolyl cis-trans isomerase [Myxococcales bacterium]